MTWWQILLALIFTVPWLILTFRATIWEYISEQKKYKKKYNDWNISHPNMQRRLCKTCKYAISETYWEGLHRYPNEFPRRRPTYCTLTKRALGTRDHRCIIAEPTAYFYEPKNTIYPEPIPNAKIYYSAYGNCYHSKRDCYSIKNSTNIYIGNEYLNDRYPCPKCWVEKDGVLYPKK